MTKAPVMGACLLGGHGLLDHSPDDLGAFALTV